MATVGSPEPHTGKSEDDSMSDGGLGKAKRNSLKDRFKLLRMREEAGITGLDDEKVLGLSGEGGTASRSGSIGFGLGSPIGVAEEKDENGSGSATPSIASPGPAPLARRPTINPNLAPGTAAGLAEGPTNSADVDWDLWQSVVYEGPTAVARSSPEDLNQAIASGIPQAIRGVVWQVLAESKSEELEVLYRELLVKGTDKEKVGANGVERRESRGSLSGNPKEKDSVRSSASSVHSDYSTPATTATNGTKAPTSPTRSVDGASEDPSKHRPGSLISKQKKVKDDVEQIRKLEKAIKRDLGARTSYSKFVMAAGLQDGLFGVCKAFALHDEAVGYAQGMNFIAMPLLFNVGL